MPPHASTAVKVAALALAAPALLLPMKAAGQQMSLGGPNFAKCDTIKDPAKNAQCHTDEDRAHTQARIKAADERIRSGEQRIQSAEQRTRAAEQRSQEAEQRSKESKIQIQVAQVEGNCAEDIGKMRAADPKATEIARELVRASGRPAAEYNICRLRDGIRDGLAAKR